MSDTKRLQFFKMINGVRTPVYIVVDRNLLIVEEGVGVPLVPSSIIPQPAAPPPRNMMAEWAVDGVDNPYPGTDELRIQYFEEEAAMKKKHEDEGHECPPCALGSLINKYRDILTREGYIT